jgi:hypothetical protein
MRTVAIKFKMRREIGFDTLFETGKRNPLSCAIKTIRASWEMAIRNIRPTVAVVASFHQRITSNVFIPGVVRDEWGSAVLTGIFIIRHFIIFGVKQMKQRLGIMKFENLLMKKNDLFSFLCIACDGDAGDGEFKPPLGFNRSANNGVIPEDLFDFIGIGKFAANADASSLVAG